jgi:predicted Zn-dependent protease
VAVQEGNNQEAMGLIERAVAEAGPHPVVLDTRALIHLQGGRAEAALQDLRQVVAQGQSASIWFHLAQAHLQARDRRAAQAAYQNAVKLGLREEDLPRLERPALRQLAAEVAGAEAR